MGNRWVISCVWSAVIYHASCEIFSSILFVFLQPVCPACQLNLIVPFWYTALVYQASLVKPRFCLVWFLSQNTHGETKRAWYAVQVYQHGTIRYLPYSNCFEFLLSNKIKRLFSLCKHVSCFLSQSICIYNAILTDFDSLWVQNESILGST